MSIICFIGKKGSGKSYNADLLLSIDPDVMKLSLATPLKQYCQKFFHQSVFSVSKDSIVQEDDIAEMPPGFNSHDRFTYRDVFIEISRRFKRSNPDFFADALVSKIKGYGCDQTYVIDDLRFANELDALMRLPMKLTVVLICDGKTLPSSDQSEDVATLIKEVERRHVSFFKLKDFNMRDHLASGSRLSRG